MTWIYRRCLLTTFIVGLLQPTPWVTECAQVPSCDSMYYIEVNFPIFVGDVIKRFDCSSPGVQLRYRLSGKYSDLFKVSDSGELILQAYLPAGIDDLSFDMSIKTFSCDDPTCVDKAIVDMEFQDFDDCSPNPCRQSARCIDRVMHFDCICPSGYGGKVCETAWDVYCNREEDSEARVTWKPAAANSSSVVPCPNGSSGNARRRCNAEGNWLAPDLSGCIRNDIREIKNELLTSNADRTSVEFSVIKLQNYTYPGKGALSAADLDMVTDILNNIVDVTEQSNDTIPDAIAEGFLHSASNSIDETQRNVWTAAKLSGDSRLPTVLKSVERFGEVYSKRIRTNDEIKSIVSPNIVLQAKRSKPKKTVFPGKSEKGLPDWLEDSSASVTMEKSTLESVYDNEQEFSFSAIFYKDIQTILPHVQDETESMEDTSVNSMVLAFSVSPTTPAKLSPPLSITFPHIHKNYSNPKCAFWDFNAENRSAGAWSTRGCYLAGTTEDETQCLCNHLTNFAILMSPGAASDVDTEVLNIISIVGCGISILGLLITMLLYLFLWKYLRTGRAVLLMNLCFALLVAYIIFLAGVTRTDIKELCTAVAVLLHYFYLAAFFFMLAEGIDIVITVVYVFATKSRTWKLLTLGWGAPLLIVGISMGATQLEGYGNENYCWLSVYNSLLWAFVGPVLLIILINIVFTILVLKALYSTSTVVSRTLRDKAKTGIRSICVLLPILGLTWVFGVFSVNEDLVVFQYLFAVFNSLQGLFIFLFYCALNKQVRDGFVSWKRSRLRKRGLSYTTETSELSFGHSSVSVTPPGCRIQTVIDQDESNVQTET